MESDAPSDEQILKMVQNEETVKLRELLLNQQDSQLVNRVKDWVCILWQANT